ncbi:Hsp20/alpha crystallin family protein [Huintestinicola sp.]|uniref:Hsp20/alpha crystallin family protein n=1 Tax=Huintestinicola sp. TaxID=2981661 RepID=UPI003D7CBDC7
MYGLTPFERTFGVFDPFAEMGSGFVKDGKQFAACRTDIREEDDRYIMESELPGFEKQDISIDISGSSLTLKAEHSENMDEKDKNGKYIRRERTYGSYQRSFDISGIDADHISADYKNGILIMVLPKKKPDVPVSRRLEIQ